MNAATLERRLAELERRAAEKTKRRAGPDWNLFTADQLAAVLEVIEAVEAGALDEAEAVARLAACPGMMAAVDAAYDELEGRR